jgi:hypothetical protein
MQTMCICTVVLAIVTLFVVWHNKPLEVVENASKFWVPVCMFYIIRASEIQIKPICTKFLEAIEMKLWFILFRWLWKSNMFKITETL